MPSSTDAFSLRWHDFESNIASAFGQLENNEDFCDVTLATEDECQIEAHKVILAACSPFFRRILKANHGHKHPLLYLKGIHHKELASVLHFMYHGQVSVAKGDLGRFVSVAEELGVRGLTENSSQLEETKSSNVKAVPRKPSRTAARKSSKKYSKPQGEINPLLCKQNGPQRDLDDQTSRETPKSVADDSVEGQVRMATTDFEDDLVKEEEGYQTQEDRESWNGEEGERYEQNGLVKAMQDAMGTTSKAIVARDCDGNPVHMLPRGSLHRTPIWTHRGRTFTKFLVKSNVLYLRCRDRKQCRVKAKIKANRKFIVKGEHTCMMKEED